jgi:hypothetical protein
MDDMHSIGSSMHHLLAEQWFFVERLNKSLSGLDLIKRTLAALPPLVDGAEPEAHSRGLVQVPLVSVDGPTGAFAVFERRGDRWELAGLGGALPEAAMLLPSPRVDGKMDARRFVGSSSLRVDRLMSGAGDMKGHERRSDPVYSVWALLYADGDIYNGGLDQFYFNSSGNFADRFPAFAAKIGAHAKAGQVATSNELFADIDLRDRPERQQKLAALSQSESDVVAACTHRYFDADDEEITDLLAKFIGRNPDGFLY